MSKQNLKNILSVSARILLAFVFVFGQTAWAGQKQDPKEKPDATTKVKAPQVQANSSHVAKSQRAEEENASSQRSDTEETSHHGGPNEGIKVHGHWTIEVRNADGTPVRRVEFENSLDGGFASTGVVVPGGGAYLSALLSGQWTAPGVGTPPTPTALRIWLVGPGGLNNLTATTNSPCNTSIYLTYGVCQIAPSSFCTPAPGASCDLSVTPLGNSPVFTGVRLAGSVTAQQNGQIFTVATVFYNVTCQASATNCSGPPNYIASFTSSTNFQGAPISVIAGQTVAVTVNISFS